MNKRPGSKGLSSATKLILYRKMFLSRKAEEKIQEEYKNDEMKTPMHMSMGEEAIATGVCAALGKRAQIFSTYRTHGTYLASTEDVKSFFAELYGKDSGPGGGKGGSMHLVDLKVNFMDPHMNELGHEITANALLEFFEKENLLK